VTLPTESTASQQHRAAPITSVFFDVDGVLLDSLAAHLRLSAEKSREYGLKLSIPDTRAFKELVRRGVVISPMKYFFIAVGFPEAAAEQAAAEYDQTFAERHPVTVFNGVPRMLSQLASAGIGLGLATANTEANVARGLGPLLQLFHPKCRFTKDESSRLSKPAALVRGAAELGHSPEHLIYVGDQPKDAEAAAEAGAQFLGVTYGWGISKEDTQYLLADSPEGVAAYVLSRRVNLDPKH
jgi:phosphoglycolate phosphatase